MGSESPRTRRPQGPASPYEQLGVGPDASLREIQTAYWRQALRCHPNQGGSEAELRAVHAAFRALVDARVGDGSGRPEPV